MARRPRGSARWLREALIARRARLVARFDCPATRESLEHYAAEVHSGAPVELSADELFLALATSNPDEAQGFARQSGPRRWVLDEDDRLHPRSSEAQ